MAWPALRREDGSVLLGLQNDSTSGDLGRDLADTLERALVAEPGTPVAARRVPAEGPRLQDLLDRTPFSSRLCTAGSNSGSIGERENASPEIAASLERANAAAIPTVKLAGVDAPTGARPRTRTTCAGSCRTPRSSCWTPSRGCTPPALLARRRHPTGRFVPGARSDGPRLGPADRMTADDVEKPAAEFAERLADGPGRGRPAHRRRSAGRAAA